MPFRLEAGEQTVHQFELSALLDQLLPGRVLCVALNLGGDQVRVVAVLAELQGTFGEHSGNNRQTFGNIRGTFREHSEIIPGASVEGCLLLIARNDIGRQ